MNRLVASMLVLGLSLVLIASDWAAEVNPEQAKAIAEIEKLGGKVTVDQRESRQASDCRGPDGRPR